MATYNDTGLGGAICGGCAGVVYVKTHTTLFGTGDIVYSLPKAKRGILEKVVIRRTNTLNALLTQGAFEVMYVDTLNSLWNEWDLVSHAEALVISKAFYEDSLVELAKINKC